MCTVVCHLLTCPVVLAEVLWLQLATTHTLEWLYIVFTLYIKPHDFDGQIIKGISACPIIHANMMHVWTLRVEMEPYFDLVI